MDAIKKNLVLGVDIGGSHITAALVDLDTRMILPDSFRRASVDTQQETEEILNKWCRCIDDSFSSLEVTTKKVGIAMPGPFDYENGISFIQDQPKFRSLYQLNIKEALAERLGVPADHIRFINDAAGFLQGEVFSGAGRNYKRVLGLTLGTGLGSALHVNGLTTDAALWNEPFQDRIAEDYLSTRWFVARYKELTGDNIHGVKELIQLPEAAEYSKKIFSEFSKNLSDFITPLVQEHEIEAVVIGGNIANASALFLPEVQQRMQDNGIQPEIKITSLKEDAALIGAASCWEDSGILHDPVSRSKN